MNDLKPVLNDLRAFLNDLRLLRHDLRAGWHGRKIVCCHLIGIELDRRRQVTLPSIEEISSAKAFCPFAGNHHIVSTGNFIVPQQRSEAVGIERAFAAFLPGAIFQAVKVFEEIGGEDLLTMTGLGKEVANIGEQLDARTIRSK